MNAPFDSCNEADAPFSQSDAQLYASHRPAWMSGTEGVPRPASPGTDSGILTLMVGVLVLVGLNMRHVRRLFRSLPHDLISVRRRENAFDEHTANETRVVCILLLETCIMEGLLLFIWLMPAAGYHSPMLSAVAALSLLAAGFYLFQLVACAAVGYVFTDPVNASLWRRGLNAAQVLLGLALAFPAFITLFYPSLTSCMMIWAAALYILSRICYIIKGFRIFYHNLPSLLYFILYLCTLEIIPVIAVCLLAADICVKMQ